MLSVSNLKAGINDKTILNGVNVTFDDGKIYAIMGPNGSGKSTLSFTIMGNPAYKIQDGKILLGSEEITHFSPDQRAKRGLFLAFQNPVEVPGVPSFSFIKTAYNTITGQNLSTYVFNKMVKQKLSELGIDDLLLSRNLNEGLSGGERKKMEIIQMAVLQPKFAILDEIDSGLDVDSLELIASAINKIHANSGNTIIMVTHYSRILRYIKPDVVYVLVNGKIAVGGDSALADKIDKEGYGWIRDESGS
ncbi:MAG: Fe-S cluster assembly ATPase SufC [Nitrososphaerota archaeon]|nr:Fe-S cluster assembly ATPase SufC [Nitrososphaerota archaeon]MDG6931579.1 Fe-S cluster assembly ATPase SufC [Nitrososphaerota archaeon]MDG6936003.1 Fe-S cluster assembly ATPase SufC [Nitrososphaerota archaeon]MDG6943943.1 Fe-S cluster assembly ATPase SufC [Nitrososphaerota archaeon]